MNTFHGSRHNITVSIVTPSFNQGRFLEATITSIISQEGDFFLDYIIMDGGSADDSIEIIKKYEELLHWGEWPIRCRGINYRWLSEKDDGQADAIKKGFEMANGDIFAWLNSDDTYLSGALQKAVETFLKLPETSVVYGRTYFTDEAGGIIGKYPTEPFDARRLATFNFISQPSTFMRKNALSVTGGLDTSLHYVMDYDLWIRLFRNFRFSYLPEFLSTYRLHKESKTISPATALANHKEALDIVRKHYCWAPLTRVYMYCYYMLRTKMAGLVKCNVFGVLLSLPVTIVVYVFMNKRIRLEDLKLIKPSNVRKLFKSWPDIYKEY